LLIYIVIIFCVLSFNKFFVTFTQTHKRLIRLVSIQANRKVEVEVRYQRQQKIQAFKQRVKRAFSDVFDNPVGRPAKKAVITVVGVCITLLGILLIILPGPAFLLIPVGLGILAIEYPIARKWLRKCQRWMTISAKKADDYFSRSKVKS